MLLQIWVDRQKLEEKSPLVWVVLGEDGPEQRWQWFKKVTIHVPVHTTKRGESHYVLECRGRVLTQGEEALIV
jgi:hypothetical protein